MNNKEVKKWTEEFEEKHQGETDEQFEEWLNQ